MQQKKRDKFDDEKNWPILWSETNVLFVDNVF